MKKKLIIISLISLIIICFVTIVFGENIEENSINIKKIYNEDDNTVTVSIISDKEFKNTKPTWQLSEDKKIYTKVFNENKNYSTPIQTIDLDIDIVDIDITEIKEPIIEVEKKYNEDDNLVTVSIKSDIKLKDTKPTWQLSEDKKTYTKVFDQNVNYSTPIISINNKEIQISINIVEIDKEPPTINIEYEYNDDDTVTVIAKSNEKLANTKQTWQLSEDKKTYIKTYSSDNNSITPFQDIYGNVIKEKIFFKKKMDIYNINDKSTILVKYLYTSSNKVLIQVTSDTEFKDTKPTWQLSEDKKTYIKTFTNDTSYTTSFINIYDIEIKIQIKIDWFYKIISEKGIYGYSGAAIHGVNGGSALEYYRWGNGPNVLFATFCVHGFEDNWWGDGRVLVNIANDFYNDLLKNGDIDLAKKWTIYIFKEINPDGLRLGYSNNGPGRTTLFSSVGRGIDINRSWQTGNYYKKYYNDRNYNGTEGFQAYEALYLRDFLLNHKSKNGQTILIDLHGWENQLIGDSQIAEYYKQQYPTCSTRNYGNYGIQYLISWGRQNLGARSVLIELPSIGGIEEASNLNYSEKYITATINMLKGID